MRLFGSVAAPAIERVVHRHRGIELGHVVPEHAGIAERDRQQSRGLGSEIGLTVSAPRMIAARRDKRFGLEIELLKHHVERAGVIAIVPGAVTAVEGGCLEPLGNGGDLRRGHVKEYRRGIDEAADQPWAGDSDDLRPCSGDPGRSACLVAFRKPVRAQETAGRLRAMPRTRLQGSGRRCLPAEARRRSPGWWCRRPGNRR